MNTEVLTTSTWAVLCTPPAGKPYPEYLEGTRLSTVQGEIQVWDGADLVKSYPAGTWSNFCEWVAVPELHPLDIIRVGNKPSALPGPRDSARY